MTMRILAIPGRFLRHRRVQLPHPDIAFKGERGPRGEVGHGGRHAHTLADYGRPVARLADRSQRTVPFHVKRIRPRDGKGRDDAVPAFSFRLGGASVTTHLRRPNHGDDPLEVVHRRELDEDPALAAADVEPNPGLEVVREPVGEL